MAGFAVCITAPGACKSVTTRLCRNDQLLHHGLQGTPLAWHAVVEAAHPRLASCLTMNHLLFDASGSPGLPGLAKL
jgi:hypothetical protein